MHDKVLSQKILNNTKNSMKLAMKENIPTKTKLVCIYISHLYNRNFLMLLFLTGEANQFKEENFKKYLDKDQNNQFTEQNFLLFNDLLHLMKLPDISTTVNTKSSCCLYHIISLHSSICLK